MLRFGATLLRFPCYIRRARRDRSYLTVSRANTGGRQLFKLDYYDHPRTSRKVLTCIAERFSRLSVFYTQKSICAENSPTRRHLSEHTHLEAELAFTTIDDLMDHIDVSLRITMIFRMFRC